jgi:hypothetical protein
MRVQHIGFANDHKLQIVATEYSDIDERKSNVMASSLRAASALGCFRNASTAAADGQRPKTAAQRQTILKT